VVTVDVEAGIPHSKGDGASPVALADSEKGRRRRRGTVKRKNPTLAQPQPSEKEGT